MQIKKSKKILLYFFLFLIIGSITNKNFTNLNFPNINKIIVSGLDEKNNKNIENKLKFLQIENLFFLNKIKIVQTINSNELVEKFSVLKKYPSTLDIKINKIKFLAKVEMNGKSFFLGSNGKFLENKETIKDIPNIFGEFDKKNFFQFKSKIDEVKFDYKKIKNLYYFKSGRWDIEMNSGLLIKLPKENVQESLKLVKALIIKFQDEEINKLDLRQKNQIVLDGK